MNRLFINNGTKYRLLRTIIQGVIGVVIANIDLLVSGFHMSPGIKAVVVALVMAILSPIMAEMGTKEMDKPELDPDHWEANDDDSE